MTNSMYADTGPWSRPDNRGDGGNAFAFRHGGGGHSLFGDGHAKFLRVEQTIPDAPENGMWGHPSPGDHTLRIPWRDPRTDKCR